MKDIVFILVLVLINFFGDNQNKNKCKEQYDNIEAFTHPLGNKSASIYYKPDYYYKEIKPDEEAGWIVQIKAQESNYFKIDIVDLNLKNIWIHKGDIGVVVQNYDSLSIPVYTIPNTDSKVIYYIKNSTIGLIYGISDDYFLLQINIDGFCYFGWVERKYLCSNPYTTCG